MSDSSYTPSYASLSVDLDADDVDESFLEESASSKFKRHRPSGAVEVATARYAVKRMRPLQSLENILQRTRAQDLLQPRGVGTALGVEEDPPGEGQEHDAEQQYDIIHNRMQVPHFNYDEINVYMCILIMQGT